MWARFLLLLLLAPLLRAGADTYGGNDAVPCPTGSATHFYSEKVGTRWYFCTPEGNSFWAIGVFAMGANWTTTGDTGTTISASQTAKYGDATVTGVVQTLNRLKSWGFNSLADATLSTYYWPWATDASYPGDHTIPTKVPLFWSLPYNSYPVRNTGSLCSQSAKSLSDGLNTTYWTAYSGQTSDAFDPCWTTWFNTYFAAPFDGPSQTALASAWTIGVSTDESDFFQFAGAGPDFATLPTAGNNKPNYALAVLYNAPRITVNEYWNVLYSDRTLYAKVELANWLQGTTESTASVSAARSGSTVTYTVGAGNKYNAGDVLTVKSCSDATFNTVAGTGAVVTSITSTTAVVTLAGAGASATGCTVTTGPGYANIAGLNAAWGSSYTGWGSDGTNYTETISTSGTPGDCNRTTWLCVGTLDHAPDRFSSQLLVAGSMVAGSGKAFRGTAGLYSPSCNLNKVVVASNVITFTCDELVEWGIGDLVNVYVTGHTYLNAAEYVTTGVSGYTFTVDRIIADETIDPASGPVSLSSAINFTTGAYLIKFPAGSTPAAGDTITVDYYYGGFGVGAGFLDEDGHHSWLTGIDQITLDGGSATIKADINNFLYHFAKTYFYVERKAVKDNYPNLLFTGSNIIGSWGTPPRREVARAAGQYYDVIRTQLYPSADWQDRLDFWGTYAGDKPLMTGVYITAEDDSSLHGYAVAGESYASQAARGQAYVDTLTAMWNNAYTSHGTHPWVGASFWTYADDFNERRNWGLVTTRDNAYDGIEAVQASVTCSAPTESAVNCGGELYDYGDFITSVKAANALWLADTPAVRGLSVSGSVMTSGAVR